MSYSIDDDVREIIKNPNMLVPWWLLGAYTYDRLDDPLISDALFDEIAVRLDKEWDTIKHRHKKLLNRKMLKSALALKGGKWPLCVRGAAHKLLNEGTVIVKANYQLTIHHTDGSTYVKDMPAETLERVQVAIVKLTLEGYSYIEGDEQHFVSPHFVTKVVLKVTSKAVPKTAKEDKAKGTNENTTSVSTDSKRSSTKTKTKQRR
jgi:hypothetical protein